MNNVWRFGRPLAALGLAASLLAGTGSLPANASPAPRDTAAFLQSHFDSGKFIAGLTPGEPDWGFSLEGLLQLKALGQARTSYQSAEKFLLLSPSISGTGANPNGYLFSGGKLKLGLAGKWLFVSAALGTSNAEVRRGIIAGMLAKIDGSGDVAPDAAANTYDRAWMVLGLVANGRPSQAVNLAMNVVRHQLPDGGFNDGFTLGSSSTDGTGITLQALSFALQSSTGNSSKSLRASIARAAAYLANSIQQDHFESYGDADVNGTAYAAMGLEAARKPTLGTVQWLKNQLVSDGGLATPWSAGAGDVYATAQGAIAAQGRSYTDLIRFVGRQ